jgi:hypothetical protein
MTDKADKADKADGGGQHHQPIPPAWHLPFELAWEALQAGSRPVGAVVVDRGGRRRAQP